MRAIAAVALMATLWQAEVRIAPEPRTFEYRRAVAWKGEAAPVPGEGCAVVPGELYARSATLSDVRLFRESQEVPYVLSTSQAAQGSDAATVLNAGMRGGRLSFDLQMPPRAYTDVRLRLGGSDFVATATVTGEATPGVAGGTALGSFTLFDLSSTGLGRSTTLKLVESTFPYLHVELAVSGAGGRAFTAAPGMIEGAEVPPSREAQTLYTTVAETTEITQVGRHSVAKFRLPAHVPVERVSFVPAAGDRTNFSRSVSVLAHAVGAAGEGEESVTGVISRVKMVQGGRELQEESLSVPATLGADMAGAAEVQVWVENGDDKPLALSAVRLEMRQRLICFGGGGGLPVLYYGDEKLEPPVYDYAKLFDPAAARVRYQLGPEERNPEFVARAVVDRRTFLDRNPWVLWVGLLGVVGVLGAVAFRSAKRV